MVFFLFAVFGFIVVLIAAIFVAAIFVLRVFRVVIGLVVSFVFHNFLISFFIFDFLSKAMPDIQLSASDPYAFEGKMQIDIPLSRFTQRTNLPRLRSYVHITAFAAYA